MKVFKGRETEIKCGHCERWIHLQGVQLVRRLALPAKMEDGFSCDFFARIYECPHCNGLVVRSRRSPKRRIRPLETAQRRDKTP